MRKVSAEHKKKTYLRGLARRASKARKFIRRVRGMLHCRWCGAQPIEFDHIDPSTKKFNIGRVASQGASIRRIKDEMRKCQPLCRPCHCKKISEEMRKTMETRVPVPRDNSTGRFVGVQL